MATEATGQDDGIPRQSQFWVLYLTRFAEGFGFITLFRLLPTYVNTLELLLPVGTVLLVGSLLHVGAQLVPEPA